MNETYHWTVRFRRALPRPVYNFLSWVESPWPRSRRRRRNTGLIEVMASPLHGLVRLTAALTLASVFFALGYLAGGA